MEEIIIENRDEVQKGQVEKWISLKARGYLEAATGYGKTRVAILSILECNKRDASRKIHVVVPTKPLANDWLKKNGHIKKWKLKNVEVFVVNTYVKQERECDLLICDELHNFSNENALYFSKVVGATKYNWFLGLSATLSPDHKNFLHSRNISFIDKVPLERCKRNGWVSEFTVINFGVDLNEADREEYNKMHDSFNRYFAAFDHDFDIAMSCLLNRDYRIERAARLQIPEEKLMVFAVQWSNNMKNRKKFLYHCSAKLEVGVKIIQDNKRITICFSESTDFTEALKEKLGPRARSYHSKNKASVNKKALKDFLDKRTNVDTLCTAKALDEGYDNPSVNMILVFSRTSKQLQTIQRIGRGIRKDGDKKTIVINLYVKNSQDEVWLRKASKGINCLWTDELELLQRIISTH